MELLKIAVITMHTIKNYGSVLQTYATQRILEEMGADVEIINYIRKKNLDSNLSETWTRSDRGAKKAIKKMVLHPTIHRWKKVFWNYLKKNLSLSEHIYVEIEDFENHPIKADIYCTGSDQVWNSGWNDGIEYPFFLTFAPSDKPKIALSASIGKSELSVEEISLIKPLLEKYRYITMREKTGLDLIRAMGIENSALCLDPTLLLSREQWLEHMKYKERRKKYVLIYQLNHNTEFDRYAVEFAKRKNLELVRFCTRFDQKRLPGKSVIIPEVEEFPGLIANAEYVITDSFHATAFSINLNTKFISIYPKDYSSRLNDILILTGLESRHLKSYEDFEIADKEIDFSSVNKIIIREREKSLNTIRYMLNMCE